MKSPFWPRTFRGWAALQLVRLAAAVADSTYVYDQGRRLMMNSNWRPEVAGGAAKHAPGKDSVR